MENLYRFSFGKETAFLVVASAASTTPLHTRRKSEIGSQKGCYPPV